MFILHGIESLPKFKNPVVAVGAFDGVHLGHVRILRFLHEQAQRIDGTSVVLTFDPIRAACFIRILAFSP